ncbi:ATP-binding protein [Myxococcota bacterium]|nr:ATP-binding protein [Myxococcota bacterium]MBU1896629.1 ATP-binding protein [Myxococcota bacterium]
MIISFSIENFRSFKSEQTLNLTASKRLGREQNHEHSVYLDKIDEHILRIASIYGANGSGKTNLIRGLSFMRSMILNGRHKSVKMGFMPFAFDDEFQKKPTCFDLIFSENASVFRYGYCFDENQVYEEWLSIFINKKEFEIFNRKTDRESGEVIVDFSVEYKKKNKKLDALSILGCRSNQLFLTEIFNLDNEHLVESELLNVAHWFQNRLVVIRPDTYFQGIAGTIEKDQNFSEFINKILTISGIGIKKIGIKTRLIKNKEIFTDEIVNEIKTSPNQTIIHHESEFFIDNECEDHSIKHREIEIIHEFENKIEYTLPIREESDGTIRLLNLIPALFQSREQGRIFIVDELERSMHPMLARKFIELFKWGADNKNSQIIFTTHESNLLDLDLLRRDNIWFTEKKPDGSTELYSLLNFNVRKDLKIDKGYLQGRFGAIPFLGDIDQFIRSGK